MKSCIYRSLNASKFVFEKNSMKSLRLFCVHRGKFKKTSALCMTIIFQSLATNQEYSLISILALVSTNDYIFASITKDLEWHSAKMIFSQNIPPQRHFPLIVSWLTCSRFLAKKLQFRDAYITHWTDLKTHDVWVSHTFTCLIAAVHMVKSTFFSLLFWSFRWSTMPSPTFAIGTMWAVNWLLTLVFSKNNLK